MLERFAPRFATLPCDSQSGATGEMIHATAEIGAPLQNMDLVECTPGSLPGSDLMVRLDIRPNRMIMVDLEGKRFVDESGYRSKIAEAILSLPEQHCWSISVLTLLFRKTFIEICLPAIFSEQTLLRNWHNKFKFLLPL